MSYRDWIGHPATGVLIFLFLGLSSVYLTNNCNCDLANQSSTYQHVQKEGQELTALESAIETPSPNLDANREERRSARELKAQMDMAKWTFGMLVTSVVGVIIATLGVVYVAFTLRATQAQVRIARDVGHTQLRSYVGYSEVLIEPLPDGSLIVIPTWLNGGQTPTRKGVSNIGFQIDESDLPPDFDYPNSYDDVSIQIAPGQSAHTKAVPVTQQQYASCRAGRVKIFIWGWIDYNDVFHKSPRRRSEFCLQLAFVNADTESERVAWLIYGPHNGTDDECLRRPIT